VEIFRAFDEGSAQVFLAVFFWGASAGRSSALAGRLRGPSQHLALVTGLATPNCPWDFPVSSLYPWANALLEDVGDEGGVQVEATTSS